MNTGILEFSLPEEADAFSVACNAMAWRDVVVDLAEYLRRRLKYEVNLDPSGAEALEAVRKELFQSLDELNLRLP